jgi:hypothetical protein|eukprot:CAMPEP_0174384936 /NCGR_PEP_ID=MMETSP0811_2-20130205/126249_1 /TAXON_ID=73025 ORGANISM="Eutreptiella gymnastica-like, Strain CCMP1594" /NCGR_SAMPLE_ID=MMETSP0811_2 /ASSEMBLY_ACC=CAM_ASM_000667 /LENGTH=79 /DNA_ID=CAMNT_0015539053 /DNA_START=1742 /DNA_END=1981 /DNA_ORIENTATION=+
MVPKRGKVRPSHCDLSSQQLLEVVHQVLAQSDLSHIGAETRDSGFSNQASDVKVACTPLAHGHENQGSVFRGVKSQTDF